MQTIQEIEKEVDKIKYVGGNEEEQRKSEILNQFLEPYKEKVKLLYRSKMIELIEGVKEQAKQKRKELWVFYHECQSWEEQKIAVRGLDEVITNLNNLLDNIKK